MIADERNGDSINYYFGKTIVPNEKQVRIDSIPSNFVLTITKFPNQLSGDIEIKQAEVIEDSRGILLNGSNLPELILWHFLRRIPIIRVRALKRICPNKVGALVPKSINQFFF